MRRVGGEAAGAREVEGRGVDGRRFNGDGERSLRVWILILGRREGQDRAKRSLFSTGLSCRRRREHQTGERARDTVLLTRPSFTMRP